MNHLFIEHELGGIAVRGEVSGRPWFHVERDYGVLRDGIVTELQRHALETRRSIDVRLTDLDRSQHALTVAADGAIFAERVDAAVADHGAIEVPHGLLDATEPTVASVDAEATSTGVITITDADGDADPGVAGAADESVDGREADVDSEVADSAEGDDDHEMDVDSEVAGSAEGDGGDAVAAPDDVDGGQPIGSHEDESTAMPDDSGTPTPRFVGDGGDESIAVVESDAGGETARVHDAMRRPRVRSGWRHPEATSGPAPVEPMWGRGDAEPTRGAVAPDAESAPQRHGMSALPVEPLQSAPDQTWSPPDRGALLAELMQPHRDRAEAFTEHVRHEPQPTYVHPDSSPSNFDVDAAHPEHTQPRPELAQSNAELAQSNPEATQPRPEPAHSTPEPTQPRPEPPEPAAPGAWASPPHPVPEPPLDPNGRPTRDDLVRTQNGDPQPPAATGWRAAVRAATFGGVKLKPGPAEREHRAAVASVQRSLSGPKTIVVLNPKGGAHKTTATLMIAATFGVHRGGNVLAWDNNETQGTLAARSLRAHHANTAVQLLRDVDRFNDVRSARVGDLDHYVRAQGDARFDVLASDDDPTSPTIMSGDDFRTLHRMLTRFYRVLVVDTGNNPRASNWEAAVAAADQLVIVSTLRDDTASVAAGLADRLHAHGLGDKLARGVTILSEPDKRSDAALSRRLSGHFSRITRAVAIVPYEPAFVGGGVLNLETLRDDTREAWLTAAAHIAEGLNAS